MQRLKVPGVRNENAGSPTSEETPAGERRRTGRGHIDSYGIGRVCGIASCRTRLSRYNSDTVCWMHARNPGLRL
jgi:hypothetical protein